ncbi:TolC family protein [Aquirufa rosea]|nr:efflux transporter outer membrane subunit [Aquirufa rosea]
MHKISILIGVIILLLVVDSCQIPQISLKTEHKSAPSSYVDSADTTNMVAQNWRTYFKDPALVALIDTALTNNQELQIVWQEIQMTNNEVKARQGAYKPFVHAGANLGLDKVGRYTSQGSSDANNEVVTGKQLPDPMANYALGLNASWELDIWKKLRNSTKSAVFKYLSTVEGKNFLVTHLVSEIANSYYELLALDNQLAILNQTIDLYQNSLEIVKLEKQFARVSELAVRRFEAEVLKNKSRQYDIKQQITETENRIHFLVGQFPHRIRRNSENFTDIKLQSIQAGIPAQLLSNRPDIKQAEQALMAAELDVKVARAEFYPTLMISAGLGYRAFNTKYLLQTPESLMFNLGGELIAPLVNRRAIKANYFSANARQIQAVYHYEQSILKAHLEVVNQLNNLENLRNSFDLKKKQVTALTESIDIASTLFKSARADYMEVLLTQRDALESKMEMVETQKRQLTAMVNIYQALGGGWR